MAVSRSKTMGQTISIVLPVVVALVVLLIAKSFFKSSDPFIEPILVNKPQLESMQRALQVLDDLSWEVANVNPAKGLIKVKAGSGFFGEVEELVIQIERQQTNLTKIDVQSPSNNANNEIGFFLTRLQKRLSH